jgi:predicted ester cyclase
MEGLEMKLTLDGTPDEIRQFLQSPGAAGAFGAARPAAPGGSPPAEILSAMTTSKSSHFSQKAIQAVTANVDTMHKVQSMLSVHDNIFAAANFSKDNLATVIDPAIEYYEFNRPITPDGIAGVARRFAEFNETFRFEQINNLLTFGDGEYLANVYEVEATHVETHEGVAATNKKVKVPGIGIMKIQNGKITEYYDAYDVSGLLPQVASAPARKRRTGKRK